MTKLVPLLPLLAVLTIGVVDGALMHMPAKAGEKVVLGFDPKLKINTWERTRTVHGVTVTETITKCIGDNKAECSGWKNVETGKVTPSKDVVAMDGRLMIASFQKTDEGLYQSPDMQMSLRRPLKALVWRTPLLASSFSSFMHFNT
ncbi:hypothetical protein L596_016816 [Steinernema carpocapsae]|uniref:Uncharacterized protein n=1 Tax=Steinernema carpocapsae TaxID=34508 RepID=A0A4U5NJ12_STECR|nr:hypothetical protein L596_016816 [Steinernema carpocapsae]